MNLLLENKKIVLVVTGSIAAYKALELLRLFVKAGAAVKVVMTQSAKRFVAPLSFEALSQNSVLCEDSESWATQNNHIAVSAWADICVIAPATVNSIAKIAHGIADNLAMQVICAFDKSVIIAPSANTKMYLSHINLQNLKNLASIGAIIAKPQTKMLACGEVGEGAMASENELFWLCARELLQNEFWSQKECIITGGGSIEAIDDVRYVTNSSSGKMANAIALAAYAMGAKVTLISSAPMQNLPSGIKLVEVKSAQDFYKATSFAVANSNVGDYLFMAAAIADFAPQKTDGKIKKSKMPDIWDLKLYKTIDVLASIDKSKIKVIGFKAETDEESAQQAASDMLANKNLDCVALNIIGKDTEFGSDNTSLRLISKTLTQTIKSNSKQSVAFELLDKVRLL